MLSPAQKSYLHALQFYLDCGVDEAMQDNAPDRTQMPAAPKTPVSELKLAPSAQAPAQSGGVTSRSDLYVEAIKTAQGAQNLEELREAIAAYEGIAIKKTATNLVFASGNPSAKIMIIGDAPDADEDRAGQPFSGEAGDLFDKILAAIGLSRGGEDPLTAAYATNIMHWRPPGGRSPSAGELELSLPFVEKHIQLIKPDLLLFMGGTAAKTLLGAKENISRLRGRWHEYNPQSNGITLEKPVPALATYHPSHLLTTPAHKKLVWEDMQALQEKHKELSSE